MSEWVVETIGLVSRVYPVEARDNLVPIYEAVKDMLR